MRDLACGRAGLPASLSILLVEDRDGDALLAESMLREARAPVFRVHRVPRVAEALEALSEAPFDAILLDLTLPDARRLEALERIRKHAPQAPVVVMTGLREEELDGEALQQGAHGYLVKGEVSAAMLARSLRQAIDRARMIRELEAAREAARHLATHDALTGIPNRLLLEDRLENAVANARRSGTCIAVLVVDLNRFKSINDTFGHGTGDEVLRCVAQRFAKQVRQSDTLARLGGDEFALVLTNLQRDTDAARVAQKLIDVLSRPVAVGAERFQTGASIGIATFSRDGDEGATLLRNADLAMYHAKRAGGGSRYQFHSREMNERALERLQIEGRLATAVVREELFLEFQPQVDLRTRRIAGAEALLRWRDPAGGVRGPASFLPIAEETGQIVEIGEWVLRRACREAGRWADAMDGPFRLSVNVSARQIRQAGFELLLDEVLASSGLAPDRLTLEITETSLVDASGATSRMLRSLKQRGIRISIDDFGQGDAALACLKRIPCDEIKIDQTFVAGIPHDPTDVTIATAILTLARGLGVAAVAEGVETPAQLEFLESAGCALAQGFLLGRPGPPEALDALLVRGADAIFEEPNPR